MTLRLVAPLLAGLGLGACGHDITLTDDIDLTWDLAVTLSTFGDTLHTPYVRGTAVNFEIYAKDEDQSFTGWTIEADDPAIIQIGQIDAGASFHAAAIAGGEGTTTLRVFDDHGDLVGDAEATVLQPDRVRLDAHGYLIMGLDNEAPVEDLRVLQGGTATYVVNYFRGDQELHGNGVLSIDPTPGLEAEDRQRFLFENREWLTVTATGDVGDLQLPLRADGLPLASVPVSVVPESDIAQVSILSESESGHRDGDWLVAYAQAYDPQHRRIFGVDYAWDVDGAEQTADGDLYRYELKKGAFEMVTASRNGMSDSTTIQSEEGYVDSTNHIGCNAGGGGASWALGLALVGAVDIRRRRRRRAR